MGRPIITVQQWREEAAPRPASLSPWRGSMNERKGMGERQSTTPAMMASVVLLPVGAR